MKKQLGYFLASLTALLSVACASSPSLAQSPAKLSAPMTMSSARTMLGIREGTYEIVSSDDPGNDICGEVVAAWSQDGNPNLTLDQQTSFSDFNRGTIFEKSGESTPAMTCYNSFTTKMLNHQLTYTMVENQNCPANYTRLDSNITVNGDVLIYNFTKTWGDVKVHPKIKAQCVLKLKK